MSEEQLRMLLDYVEEVAAAWAENVHAGYAVERGPNRDEFVRRFLNANSSK